MKKKKSKIKEYCRYHHFNTHPGKQSHQDYISILSRIEEIGSFDLNDIETQAKGWNIIKHTIDNLTDDQTNDIFELISKK